MGENTVRIRSGCGISPSPVPSCDYSFLGSSVGFFIVSLFLPWWSFPTHLSSSSDKMVDSNFYSHVILLSQPSSSSSKTKSKKDRQKHKGIFRRMSFFTFCFIEHLLFADDCVKAWGKISKVIGFPPCRRFLVLIGVPFSRLRKISLGFGIELKLHTYISLHT